MLKWLRRLFWTGIASTIIVLGVAIFLYRFSPQTLIDIRFAHLSRLVPNTDGFDLPPSQLRADGFLVDEPEEIAAYRRRAENELPYLSKLPAHFEAMSTLDRAKQLTLLMSGGGGAGGFSDATLLMEKLQTMPAGMGKCSDLVEGFLALCTMYGIDAYELSITHHTIAAVYCPEYGQWIMLDPEFCLIAKDPEGRYLSPKQVRERAFSGRSVDFYFFGNPSRQFARLNPQALGYYDDPTDYGDFILPFGNNVIHVNSFRRNMRWIPKPLRQIWYWAIGIMPPYEIVNDQYALMAPRLNRIRIIDYSVASILTLLLTPFPAARAWRRLFPSREKQAAMPETAPVANR
ncbi:MAG: hypothetical protein HZB38_13980 [Planctomycetes bacterium]|nr:hypothetical protein [Planctomycetota bacterium]